MDRQVAVPMPSHKWEAHMLRSDFACCATGLSEQRHDGSEENRSEVPEDESCDLRPNLVLGGLTSERSCAASCVLRLQPKPNSTTDNIL